MKSLIKLLISIISATTLTSCPTPPPTTNYIPIYIERSDLEASIRTLAPKPIKTASKVVTINNLILIVNQYKGIHIINNSTIQSPENISYIVIPGVKDITYKDGIIYANSAIDLIAINISNIQDGINVIDRKLNYFEEPLPPDIENGDRFIAPNRPTETSILMAWETLHDDELHF